MFGIKAKKTETTSVENTQTTPDSPRKPKGYTPPKGTPTPKRKDVELRNRKPIVADNSKLTREQKKELKRENRRKSDEQYKKEQQAMRTGDETYMPAHHRGRVRRWGRDYIDASAPISGWFMPLAFLLIPLIFLQMSLPKIAQASVYGAYGVFLIMTLHAGLVTYRVRLLAGAKFGFEKLPRGFTWQMFGRCFYIRRWRLPAPQVKRNEFPEGATRSDLKAARKLKKSGK